MSDSSIPTPPAFSLARRLRWTTAARLLLIGSLFAVTVSLNVRAGFDPSTFTVRVALLTVGMAFALSAVYGWLLRTGKHLQRLVSVQLVLDQAIWSVVVYLSGGITSGATSFYGISCLLGAILAGFRGAAIAALAAGGFYFGLAVMLVSGRLPPPPDQPIAAYNVTAQELVYSVVVTALMLVVVALLAGNLTERLRVTGGQLVRAEARANQAEREALLGRLSAALAHEIRNPLGAISGSIRLLSANPELADEDRRLCNIVESEAWRLDDLVSDMVNLGNPRRPVRAVVDAASIAQDVVSLAQHSGRGAGDVEVCFEGEQTLPVLADPDMVRQMLWNLVRNAVQASEVDTVVRVRVTHQDEQGVVEIIDHGIGIDETAKSQIFDAFFTTRSQGTGIGLAVVKRIADDHGWKIVVDDTQPRGATFRVHMGVVSKEPVGSVPSTGKGRWTLSPGPS